MTAETKWWLLGAGGGVVIGSFLPWVTAGFFSFPGTEGDGAITLVLGGLIFLAGLIGKVSKMTGWGVIALSALSLFIVGNVFTNLADELTGGGLLRASPGTGLFVVGIGALAGVAAGTRVLREANTDAALTPETAAAEDADPGS